MSDWSAEDFGGGALAGAGTGAAIGSVIPGLGTGIGAGIGALGGGLLGLFSGHAGRKAASGAASAQNAALDAAMKRLQDFSQQQYANRMQDLDKTMSFYGPAQRYLESIYGGAATGPQALKGPPGVTPPGAVPPGFPKPMAAPTPMTFGQPGKGRY